MDPSALTLFAEGATTGITLAAPHLSISISLAIVALLLAVNGFFVALEFSLVAVRRTKVDEMVKHNLRGARSLQRGKVHIDDFVATAQLGITVASLALGMVAEDTVLDIINRLFGVELSHQSGLGFALSIAIVTVFHVVLGEQLPKMISIERPERVALFTAPIAEVVLTVCKPMILALSWLTGVFLRILRIPRRRSQHSGEIFSEEEIQAMLLSRQQAGEAEPQELEMISRVFRLFEMVATEIMIPRTEMISIASSATVGQAMEVAAEAGHDRYPVYGENTDEIVGVLFTRDLISFLAHKGDGRECGITSLWRDALFVPGTLPCAQLLTQMREQRCRLAIVLDEYGGTAGMLTLGDVLKRIVGALDEEVEEEPERIVAVGENLFSISGLVLTRDVESFFQITIADELNDTIGGVVFSHLGRAPVVGDDVVIDGLTFRVVALDGMRIARLLVNTVRTRQSSAANSAPPSLKSGKQL